MPLSQLRNVNFGRSKLDATGSSGVGYQLLDELGAVETSRTTTGVYQTAPGIYAAYISFPDSFRGQVLWDTGTKFATTFYATEQYNVEENDPRIAEIHAQTTYVSGAIAGVSSSVGNISNVLNEVSGNVDYIYQITADTQTNVNQMSGTLNDVYDIVLNISSSVDEFSSVLNVVSGNVDQISDTTAQIFGIVSNIQTNVNQMSGTLNDVYDLVFDLSGTINVLSSSAIAISSSAILISSSAAIIDNSVTTLSGAIADLSQISGTLASIETKIDKLVDSQYGRWLIDNNQMIFYKEDNVTEVARFDLFDDSGNPTMDAVFERVKV